MLDEPVFPQKDLDTLFDYILLDDVPHPEIPCPQDGLPRCSEEEIRAGYRLSWQLLERGVNRRVFRRLIAKIMFSGTASPQEQLTFKYMRARFKHMRFACANFDKKHRYPFTMHIVTILMGNMQDAFKNRQRRATWFYGLTVWLILTPFLYWLVRGPLLAFDPETPEGLVLYQRRENEKLCWMLKNSDRKTGHEFHNMRKIISRRTAFNDTLRTIRPSAELNQLSEYLATINGMMGDMHDELVEKKLDGTQNYKKDRFQPPEEILARLQEFLARDDLKDRL